MKTNIWQRVGTLASVVWLLISCSAYFYELKNHPSKIGNFVPISAYEWVQDPGETRIRQEKAKTKGEYFPDRFVILKPNFSQFGFVFFALGPLILGWVIAYLFQYKNRSKN
jgi:hypothetical protein